MGCIVKTYSLLNLLELWCAFERWLYGAQAQGRLSKWGRMGKPLSGECLLLKRQCLLFHVALHWICIATHVHLISGHVSEQLPPLLV